MSLPGNSEFTREWFDESSREWMKNKARKGYATRYKCEHIHTNDRRCNKAQQTNLVRFCKQHHVLRRVADMKENDFDRLACSESNT
jgi:hypothetical protein